jgi:hypothetical protein
MRVKHIGRALGVLVVLFMVLTLKAGSAHAFPADLLGYTWADYKLNLECDSCAAGGRLDRAVRRTLNDWLSIPGMNFPFLGNLVTNNNAPVPWLGDQRSSVYKANLGPWTDHTGTVMRTSWAISDSTQFCPCIIWEADMRMNNQIPSQEWIYDAALSDSVPDSLTWTYDNIWIDGPLHHELGRTLGFKGFEGRRPAVMNFAGWEAGKPWLHGDDRNGLRTFYPSSSQPPFGGWETDIEVTGWTVDDGGSAFLVPVEAPEAFGGNPDGSISVGSGSMLVHYTLENLGTEYVSPQSIGIYLSRDQVLTPTDILIDSSAEFIPSPAIGGYQTEPARLELKIVNIPCGIDTGYYYVGVIADYSNQLSESREPGKPQDNNSALLPGGQPVRVHLVPGSNDGPQAPLSLTASDNLCGVISVMWGVNNSGTRPTQYIISRNGVPIDSVRADTTMYLDYAVPGPVLYQVRAKNLCGYSSLSNSDTGVRNSPTIPKPSNLRATQDSCRKVDVTWEWSGTSPKNFGVTCYGCGWNPVSGTLPGGLRSYQITDAKGDFNNGRISFSIWGIDSSGCLGDVASCSGRDWWPVNTPPQYFSATQTVCSHVELAWDEYNWCYDPNSCPFSAKGIRIKRRNGAGAWETLCDKSTFSFRTILRSGSYFQQTYWRDSTATYGVSYEYSIEAYTSCNTSPIATGIGLRPLSPTTVPTVTATSGACDGIPLNWIWLGAAVDSFRILRDNVPFKKSPLGTQRSWVDSTASLGSYGNQSHSYKVQPIFPGGCPGYYSSAATGTRGFCGVPGGGYVYLDTNGNGVNDVGDSIDASGSTNVDIWLSTNHNRDGSQATCSNGCGLLNAIKSYSFVLRAVGGTVVWSGFTNHMPGYGISTGVYSDPIYYANGMASGGTFSPSGTYRLASVTVTPSTGTPSLVVAKALPDNPDINTSFGSDCPGLSGTSTLKLGLDWRDSDGAGVLDLWRPEGVPLTSRLLYVTDLVGASDGAGGAVFVWVDTGVSTGKDIYAQRVDATGNPYWGPNGIPICTAVSDQDFPCVTPDGTGGVIISWEDDRAGDWYKADIYAQRVNAFGSLRWNVDGNPVCTANRWSQLSRIARRNMVSDGAGGAIIGWSDGRADSGFVYVQRIDGSGSPLWTLDGVKTALGGTPALISDGAHGAIIVYQDRGACPIDWKCQDLYAQHIDSLGAVTWPKVPICTVDGLQWKVDGVSDGAGGAIVAWQDLRTAFTERQIYAQHILDSGSTQWAPNGLQISAIESNGQDDYGPSLALDGGGGAFLAYKDTLTVKVHRISGVGSISWTARLTPAPFAAIPEVRNDGSGNAILVWSSSDGYVRTQKLDGNGMKLWGTNPIVLAGGYGYGEPVVVADGTGGCITERKPYNYITTTPIFVHRVAPAGGLYTTDVPEGPGSPNAPTSLGPTYPNPFNPSVTIRLTLRSRGPAKLTVYDTTGRRVRTLLNRNMDAGSTEVRWDGRNDHGDRVASGIYYCRLETVGNTATRSLALIK